VDAQNVTLPLAFLAGLLSFASPCVLPLVPAYLGYLGGTAVLTEGASAGSRKAPSPFYHALAFVLGFTVVFVLLGASATFLGRFLLDYRLVLQRVGSMLLVIFGMRLMGAGWVRWRWIATALAAALLTFALDSGVLLGEALDLGEHSLTWLADSLMVAGVILAGAEMALTLRIFLGAGAGILNFMASVDELVPRLIASLLIVVLTVVLNRAELFYAEKRIEIRRSGQTGLARSFVFGFVFAAGWTPCIGPILTGILIVASQLQTVAQGILFLAAYSLGLGIPFLLVGLAFGPLSKALRRMNRYLGVMSIVSGILLVLLGILLLTDSFAFLARYGSLFDLNL